MLWLDTRTTVQPRQPNRVLCCLDPGSWAGRQQSGPGPRILGTKLPSFRVFCALVSDAAAATTSSSGHPVPASDHANQPKADTRSAHCAC